MHRRSFLALAPFLAAARATRKLAPGVELIPGPVNSVIITQSGRRLAIYGDPRRSPQPAEQVLLTHFRRDVSWAARELARQGAEVVAPAGESELISNPESFWRSFEKDRWHDYAMRNSRVLTEPLPVRRFVRDGDRIEWRDFSIEVLDTPGYSAGAVSYLFHAGNRLIACTGDLIYGDGQLLDLWSLQGAVPEAKLRGYHGYAARAGELIRSLRAISARKPDILVPARGPLVEDPPTAIERLIGRLKAALREHFTTDALRWYFGDDNLRLRAGKLLEGEVPPWMPMAETAPLPRWLIAIGNSRLMLSKSGAAFLIDCGYDTVIQEIERLRSSGRLSRLEGIFITHYHDDHTDRAQACAERFGCPVYFTTELREMLERPAAFRMPCLSPHPIRNGKPVAHGTRQRWHEFELVFTYFPGQTLFHDALLAHKDAGESILFVGDSFTPSGLDDYCLWNRNFLAPGEGFWQCLEQLRRLPPGCLLVNQHVEPAFRFSPAQLDSMEQSLRRRREAMSALFPWPDPDFGLDEQWIRLTPYETSAPAGRPVELRAVIRNHSARQERFVVSGRAVSVPARTERSIPLRFTPPTGTRGLFVFTVDVEFAGLSLRHHAEALIQL